MLQPRLTLSQPLSCRNVLRLSDATGDYDAVFNPGGFGSPNTTRSAMRATLSIQRAADSTIILAESPLTSDLFVRGRAYDLSINLPDAAYFVITRIYSELGQAVPLCTYQIDASYPADARLRVRQGDHWIDVTSLSVIHNGRITWVAAYSPDVYSSWQLTHPTSGAVYASGSCIISDCQPSPTFTIDGDTEALAGYNAQLFIADGELRHKLGQQALGLSLETGHHPSAATRLAAWGKLFYEHQTLGLIQADTLPALLDAKLAWLHRLADRLC